MNGVNSIFETVKNYIGSSGIGLLFVVCLFWLIVYYAQEKKNKTKKVLIWVIFFSVFLLLNDVSMRVLEKFTDSATFYRFLWAVPVVPVIGYTAVKLFSAAKGISAKLVLVGLCVLLLALMGKGYVSTEALRYPGTMEKIPQDVKTICQVIEEHKTVERPICMFDQATQLMVRSENPSIVWAVGREPYRYFQQYGYDNGSKRYRYSENLLKVVDGGIQIKRKKLRKTLRKKNVEFLVVKKEYAMDEYLKKTGLNPVGESDNYTIYQYINNEKEQ